MKRLLVLIVIAVFVATCYAEKALAAPDQYPGDTSIYGGSPVVLQPNVLIIVDNSGSMGDSVKTTGSSYSSSMTYSYDYSCTNSSGLSGNICETATVYDRNNTYLTLLSNVSATCVYTSTTPSYAPSYPKSNLTNNGQYTGYTLKSDGSCCYKTVGTKTQPCGNFTYYTGNYINWLASGATTSIRKIDIATDVMAKLVQTTTGIKFGLMTYHYGAGNTAVPGGTQVDYPGTNIISAQVYTTGGSGYSIGDILWLQQSGSRNDGQVEVVTLGTNSAVATINLINAGRGYSRGTATTMGGLGTGCTITIKTVGNGYGGSNAGADGAQFLVNKPTSGVTASYVTTVKNMDDIFNGTTTNRQALADTIQTLNSMGWTPLGESLFEAMRYFQGGASGFGNTIGVDVATGGTSTGYISPIQYGCQKNYVIFISDGDSTADDKTLGTTGCSGSSSLSCVAKYMYEHDLIPDSMMTGTQNVSTYTIGFGISGTGQTLLKTTADATHGRGAYYDAKDAQTLSKAFAEILGYINDVDSSFVAPVVPVSPENRTYSGSRVYMGFFKPEPGLFWTGNLKKYGLDEHNNILDQNGGTSYATWMDSNNNKQDDRDGGWEVGAVSGGFRSTSKSYWNNITDKGAVELGGVGQVLQNMATTSRIIFSNPTLATNVTLSTSANLFVKSKITTTILGLTPADTAKKDYIVDFIYGLDSFNTTTANRGNKRNWILGDILHSKPQIVTYTSYTTATDESDCTKNKTMIYVGSNDGMLHAFKDCDGSEAWAFIPPDLLPVLQYQVSGNAHTYFVDFSPNVYIFNSKKDGTIDPTRGDKVIMLLGLRRGGGNDDYTSTNKGFYYALDITQPMNPTYLWRKTNADFSEMAESWSDVTFAKIKVGTTDKIAALVGAGYDNYNEDARFGATQSFCGIYGTPLVTMDTGTLVSSPSATAINPKGRGMYIIEVASIPTGTTLLSFTTSGNLLKSFTNANVTGMNFSIPSRIKPLDTNYDNYIDRLYANDLGGNTWAFDISSTSTSSWFARKIFSSNPGADSTTGRKIFYEPAAYVLENGAVQLFFGTGDREHPLNRSITDRIYSLYDRGQTTTKTENDMVDVTLDLLQETGTTTAQVADIMSSLTSSANYGWFIKLDQNSGEKVLANASFFNQSVTYTTYAPDTVANPDPCVTGNLGAARAYRLNYLTGEAVFNYDATNGEVVKRSDRVIDLGSGIPSGAVQVISSTGETVEMIGVGGSITTLSSRGGGVTMPLYWRQKTEYQ